MGFALFRGLKRLIFGEEMKIDEIEEILSQETVASLGRGKIEENYISELWTEGEYSANEMIIVKLKTIAEAPRNHEDSELIRENATTLSWYILERLQSQKPKETIKNAKGVEGEVVIPGDSGIDMSILDTDFSSADKPVRLGLLSGPSLRYSDLEMHEKMKLSEIKKLPLPMSALAANFYFRGINDPAIEVRARAFWKANAGQNLLKELSIDYKSSLREYLGTDEIPEWLKEKIIDCSLSSLKTEGFETISRYEYCTVLERVLGERFDSKLRDIESSVLTPSDLKSGDFSVEPQDLRGREIDDFEVDVKDEEVLYEDRDRRSSIAADLKIRLDGNSRELPLRENVTLETFVQFLGYALDELEDGEQFISGWKSELRRFDGRYHVKIDDFEIWSIEEGVFKEVVSNLESEVKRIQQDSKADSFTVIMPLTDNYED